MLDLLPFSMGYFSSSYNAFVFLYIFIGILCTAHVGGQYIHHLPTACNYIRRLQYYDPGVSRG